jgi:hypothetical protein
MPPDIHTAQQEEKIIQRLCHTMIHSILGPELVNKIVKGIPLFANFTERKLSLLLDRTNVYSYRKDEIIIQADEH